MREMGFSTKWEKLNHSEFTTFRLPRKDRDWAEGETIKIVYHPREKDREVLGKAQIISKEPRLFQSITHLEAAADGFKGGLEMWEFLGQPKADTLFYKLALRWA